ncbi:hypothetical protein [Bacillus cereus group sp. N21]|uniref:hypothetical protein n=1 Tax=Bacillus cereus group sp. N21 TaxID=2794591 RepID=UPI0018F4A192|nr:hypothetical protein [Bacillus cereus group sp. N21]MBJ8029320.1 hypothetical protein [Bacillus cereus group sp. N21]
MIRYLKFSLQFVVLCIVLTLLFDMIGWFIFKKKQIENKTVIIPLIMAGWTLYIFRYKTPSKTP